jgi:molecular chaperone DnaK
VQIVEGESANPDDCVQLGKCSVRDLPANLPEKTPIEVKFRYEDNGRLTVMVSVEGVDKQRKHELTRENTLSQEQLDAWRKYVTGIDAGKAPASGSQIEKAGGVTPAEAEDIPVAELEEDDRT